MVGEGPVFLFVSVRFWPNQEVQEPRLSADFCFWECPLPAAISTDRRNTKYHAI
jgi:hypothetical protein